MRKVPSITFGPRPILTRQRVEVDGGGQMLKFADRVGEIGSAEHFCIKDPGYFKRFFFGNMYNKN